jgi:dUTP pyrophosphatase
MADEFHNIMKVPGVSGVENSTVTNSQSRDEFLDEEKLLGVSGDDSSSSSSSKNIGIIHTSKIDDSSSSSSKTIGITHTSKIDDSISSEDESFFVIKKHPDAIVPTKGSEGAAGWDLYSLRGIKVWPMYTAKIRTGISIRMPPGCYGRIAERSSMSVNNKLHVLAGVVDTDFEGSLTVVVQNLSQDELYIPPKTRIAQLIFEKIFSPKTLTVLKEEEMKASTVRGSKGFGVQSGSDRVIKKRNTRKHCYHKW